jgi:hypothetical protein
MSVFLQLLVVAWAWGACAIAQECDSRVTEAKVSVASATTQLADVAEVEWPRDLPPGTRVRLATSCEPVALAVFDETTAVFGKLARTPYAIRISVAEPARQSFRYVVRLAIPAAAAGRRPRVFIKAVEGGANERHEAFGPLDTSVSDGRLIVTLDSGDLIESNVAGYTAEAWLIIAWS